METEANDLGPNSPRLGSGAVESTRSGNENHSDKQSYQMGISCPHQCHGGPRALTQLVVSKAIEALDTYYRCCRSAMRRLPGAQQDFLQRVHLDRFRQMGVEAGVLGALVIGRTDVARHRDEMAAGKAPGRLQLVK